MGVDVSAEQVRRARENVPAADVIHADALELALPPECLDAVAAFYVLDHVPRREHARMLARIAQWLRLGGYLLFTAEVEDVDDVVAEWPGVPMFFSCFDAETTLRLTGEAGFAAVRHARETQLEGDREVEWLWVLARKAGEP